MSNLKIGVISDSHGNYSDIDLAMIHLKNVDLLIHAGDYYKDAAYINENYGIRVLAVAGNCDDSGILKLVEEIEDRRFFITHGHLYGVKHSINRIYYAGKENDADVVIFGHSHVPFYLEEDGIIFINPGSLSIPRGMSQKSCCIIEIDNEIKVDFINI